MIPKFRAWDKELQTMNGMAEIYRNKKQEIELHPRDEHIILMQSTGLCDKEGTEVFEGDILHHQIQTEYTFIVKYDKDNGRWYGDGLSRRYRIDITKDFLPYYKVIGNIYENKNLLEVNHGTI
jgi:hypothetical protein|nr:MAG TPA: YopX protein [Caudoviricetes sp.]